MVWFSSLTLALFVLLSKDLSGNNMGNMPKENWMFGSNLNHLSTKWTQHKKEYVSDG